MTVSIGLLKEILLNLNFDKTKIDASIEKSLNIQKSDVTMCLESNLVELNNLCINKNIVIVEILKK